MVLHGSGVVAITDTVGSSTWRAGVAALWIGYVEDTASTYDFHATHDKTFVFKIVLSWQTIVLSYRTYCFAFYCRELECLAVVYHSCIFFLFWRLPVWEGRQNRQ
jgi:hypothetical protein